MQNSHGGVSYSPITSSPRIFPGLVHARHRKTSMRQASGAENEGDVRERSNDFTESMSSDLGDGVFNHAVLEEAAEDS